jgi:acetate kinase
MTATLLVVDAGSSSVKLDAYDLESVYGPSMFKTSGTAGATRTLRHIAHTSADVSGGRGSIAFKAMLTDFLEQNAIIDVHAVAHRIVHGGMEFCAPCVLDEISERALAGLTALAPLHMPIALDLIALCRAIFGPSVLNIAVFDTAFFAKLPAVAQRYAIPLYLQQSHHVRRFGFHGLAHDSMLSRIQNLRPDRDRGGRIITLQLGAGCSAAAIDHGVPVDTSMGFSPLEGLVMATRSGDIDAGLVTYLQRTAGFTPDTLERLLNTESGLLGISGESGDMRVLLESTNRDARFAIDLYCYRIRKYIGAYVAVLGGLDAIAIGGGVGENSPVIRKRILSGMEWCGISVDDTANESTHATSETDARISPKSGPVDVWVVAVDEGAVLAREAALVLRAARGESENV